MGVVPLSTSRPNACANESALMETGLKARLGLLSSIRKRKFKYFGHLIRENRIQRVTQKGKIEERRYKGRRRVNWMDNIKDWMNLNYCDCVRLANNREEWR